MSTPLEQLNSKVFREQLQTTFQTGSSQGRPLQLKLIEVTESHEAPQIEFFSLHFLGPVTPRLAQQIHRLEHPKLGAFEIFLTAISADQQGAVYEAIFHRFRKQP